MSTSSPSTALTTIWTIGHSARRLEEFLRLFAEVHIDAIAAVRSFPGSRKCPRYGKDVLSTTVTGHAIGYHWLPALGGRRRVSRDRLRTKPYQHCHASYLSFAYLALWPLYFGFAASQFLPGRRTVSWFKGIVTALLAWASTQALAALAASLFFQSVAKG